MPQVYRSAFMKNLIKWAVLLVFPLFIIDQMSKYLIAANLKIDQGIIIIPGLFEIIHVRNAGAAFGILQWIPDGIRTVFFLFVTIVACAVIVLLFLLHYRDNSTFIKLMLSLVLAGALGNLADRLRLKEVIDFLNFHIGHYYWPTFNMADMYISVAIVGLFLNAFIGARRGQG